MIDPDGDRPVDPGEEGELTFTTLTKEALPLRDSLRARAEHQLGEETGLRIIVAVLDPGSLPRSDGKAVRVVDRRPR